MVIAARLSPLWPQKCALPSARSLLFLFSRRHHATFLPWQSVRMQGFVTAAATARSSLPVVYHPLYSAPQLPEGHRFPMQVFRTIYDTLLSENIIKESQVSCFPTFQAVAGEV